MQLSSQSKNDMLAMRYLPTKKSPRLQKIRFRQKLQKLALAHKFSKEGTKLEIFGIPFCIMHQWIESGQFIAENLNQIYIFKSVIKGDEMKVFRKYNFRNVTQFTFYQSKFNYLAFEQFAKADWTNLKVLDIRENPIEKNGIRQLCKMDLPNLWFLRIQFCQITPSSYKVLSKLSFPSLKRLFINHNMMKTDDLQIMTSFFKQIKSVYYLQSLYLVEKIQICVYILSDKEKLKYCDENNMTVIDFCQVKYPDIMYRLSN